MCLLDRYNIRSVNFYCSLDERRKIIFEYFTTYFASVICLEMADNRAPTPLSLIFVGIDILVESRRCSEYSETTLSCG